MWDRRVEGDAGRGVASSAVSEESEATSVTHCTRRKVSVELQHGREGEEQVVAEGQCIEVRCLLGLAGSECLFRFLALAFGQRCLRLV